MNKLSIVLPGVIWPDVADLDYILGKYEYPALATILAKGKLQAQNWAYSDFYYQHNFIDKKLSLAENYATQLGLPKEHGYLLLEPTNLRPDRDRLLIAESALLQIDEDEARSLLGLLNQHFCDDGLKFHYLNDELWLLELAEKVTDLKTYPLLDIIGSNIDEYLPEGKDALKFHCLLNEIQMLFFNNEINQLRQSEGSLSINSVWLWDKNYLDLSVDFSHILSNTSQDVFHKLQEGQLKEQLTKASLVIIDQAYYPAVYRDSFGWLNILEELDTKFINPMLKMLKLGKITKIDFYLPFLNNSWQITLSRCDLLKFWQKGNYKNGVIKLSN